jgi:hypothetical protein
MIAKGFGSSTRGATLQNPSVRSAASPAASLGETPSQPSLTNAAFLDPSRKCPEVLELERQLTSRIVGQADAISQILNHYQTYLAGLSNPGRPVCNLLMLGPTGCGKTRIVEALAESLAGDRQALIKIDCGEFQHSHEIAKLIGSPPGYLGHRETHPRLCQERLDLYHSDSMRLSFVLFDEIEKASDALWNLLLGILDKGSLTLGDNRQVDFSSAMVFMTGNLGTAEAQRLRDLPWGFAAPRKDWSERSGPAALPAAAARGDLGGTRAGSAAVAKRMRWTDSAEHPTGTATHCGYQENANPNDHAQSPSPATAVRGARSLIGGSVGSSPLTVPTGQIVLSGQNAQTGHTILAEQTVSAGQIALEDLSVGFHLELKQGSCAASATWMGASDAKRSNDGSPRNPHRMLNAPALETSVANAIGGVGSGSIPVCAVGHLQVPSQAVLDSGFRAVQPGGSHDREEIGAVNLPCEYSGQSNGNDGDARLMPTVGPSGLEHHEAARWEENVMTAASVAEDSPGQQDSVSASLQQAPSSGARERAGGFPGSRAEESDSGLLRKMEKAVLEAAKRKFSPEFLNRLDRVILCHALDRDEIGEVLDLELGVILERVQRHRHCQLRISLTAQARGLLVAEGFNPDCGARYLKRTIEKHLVQPLSSLLATGQISDGDELIVDLAEGGEGFTFRRGTRIQTKLTLQQLASQWAQSPAANVR